mmetsp:Transcript_95454/g.165803  ORF Transcript_95454/g.165803 Transcript_95454/m.165803 type:complete len:91 (-) Transcript_95454:86-358(-)
MSLKKLLDGLGKQMAVPGSPVYKIASWTVALTIAGKWIYESEQQDPWMFSEAPTMTGTPQAREFSTLELEKWNSGIQPKDEQLTWKRRKD